MLQVCVKHLWKRENTNCFCTLQRKGNWRGVIISSRSSLSLLPGLRAAHFHSSNQGLIHTCNSRWIQWWVINWLESCNELWWYPGVKCSRTLLLIFGTVINTLKCSFNFTLIYSIYISHHMYEISFLVKIQLIRLLLFTSK